jgi:hypothetical protein
MQRHFPHRPEPLLIHHHDLNEKREIDDMESPVLSSSASSSGYWSPTTTTSEPGSPITPHSPLPGQFDFHHQQQKP